MRSFKDKNIHNQQVDYNSDGLSDLTNSNDNSDINKQKNSKTWVGIFKSMGGNFPGGSLIVGNFLGGSFPDTVRQSDYLKVQPFFEVRY